MSEIDITDLLERITGCINNAEYDDEADTLSDAFAVIEAQAAEIEKFSGIAKLAILKAYDTDKFSTATIEAQAAEIERLRYELRCIFSDYRGYMDHEWIADVLAALGETE